MRYEEQKPETDLILILESFSMQLHKSQILTISERQFQLADYYVHGKSDIDSSSHKQVLTSSLQVPSAL
jgi:hypothetical protein